jgi:uncharacterized Zn finger protein
MAKRKTESASSSPATPATPAPAPSAEQRQAWLANLAETRIAELTYPAVMERGRQILASGAIQKPQLQFPAANEAALLATVVGTEPYQVGVMLSGSGRVALQSSCTCPHAEDGHFCKHQVALALRLRAELSGEVVDVDPEAAKKHAATLKRAATAAARTAALRDFLAAQPSDALAERLMQFAGRQPDLRRELLAWQATAEATGDAKSMAKLVTELLPLRDFLDWRESNAYARAAGQVLPVLQGALQAQPPGEALKLVERAYLRLQKQLHQADDSDGQIGDLCESVGALWLQALRQAGPQPAAFGDRYAALRDDTVFDPIPHADALAAMGEAAARRYGERLRSDFEAARAAAQGRPREGFRASGPGNLWSARHRYLDHLRASGDAEERLRVLRSSLETELDHVDLILELNDRGRAREALDSAERAHRLFPDAPRIEALLLDIYTRDGWDAEALAVRQARFARAPGAATAVAVLQAADRAKVAVEPLRASMWQALVDEENAAFARRRPRSSFAPECKPSGPDVSQRLVWLMHEGRLDEALALAQPPHVAATDLLRQLAHALPRSQDEAAVALLRRCFDAQMPTAASPYAGVLELVRRIAERMLPAARDAWLAGLRQTYRAKRNFIKGLP